MAQCNYCTFQGIKRVAEKANAIVETRPAPWDNFPTSADAIDVFIRYPNQAEPVWAAWLMRLPDRCAC